MPLAGLDNISFVLASKSPRRKMLFEGLGFPFEVRTHEVDEAFDEALKGGEIPMYLAEKKAAAFQGDIAGRELIITADTIVWINDRALNKPANRVEAHAMLQEISGATHSVFTGVCLTTAQKQHSFVEETTVTFNPLQESEIEYYLDAYAPFDKAGAYGIQEFIGLIGIQRIDGDFYNVVGFPMQRFWAELKSML
ncbi:MAG: septum formation protein Maf [Flavobacteriales bacterium]|nr:septum formation protein Maf [Flavobacteriales bacterium]